MDPDEQGEGMQLILHMLADEANKTRLNQGDARMVVPIPISSPSLQELHPPG